MEIFYICPTIYGGEIPFCGYTQGLARLGHEVYVFVTGRDGEPYYVHDGVVMVERNALDLFDNEEKKRNEWFRLV